MTREYLLFSELPYDFFSADLPLDLGNGVLLDRPDAAYAPIMRDDQLSALLLPDVVGGQGQVHV